MRDEFVRTLTEIARQDQNVVLITGDLGFGVLTGFAREFPRQFLNIGVAEQNMTGVAVGMALEGRVVFTYSIGNFPTLRCLEQIRNDACYHKANVKIVSIGGGFCYGALGVSHHATEDLAIMRALPEITVVAPGDTVEVAAATRAIYRSPGTCYLRLGRGGEPRVHDSLRMFEIGKALQLFDGNDIAIMSTGGILKNAYDARQTLAERGYKVALYSVHTVKPIDRTTIQRIAETCSLVVTVEEHNILGGLGGAVAEVMAEMPRRRAVLKMIGLQDRFSCEVGDQEYLRSAYGLSVASIVETTEEAVKSVQSHEFQRR
ncbi:MAG: transketolase [Firmicutes bacterium]|nr:transketolase [Bacillota bacterium]MBU4554199.1 transketolase [Bacillota bacterium]MBV1734190.1 transketolase [Desulforudis sp.]MBV1769857.1 transketolase [Desulforudis sp.]